VVATGGGPADAQARGTAGCPVNDRESPCVTLLMGMWRARRGSLNVDDLGPAEPPRLRERFCRPSPLGPVHEVLIAGAALIPRISLAELLVLSARLPEMLL
jgi:hypothetical protein